MERGAREAKEVARIDVLQLADVRLAMRGILRIGMLIASSAAVSVALSAGVCDDREVVRGVAFSEVRSALSDNNTKGLGKANGLARIEMLWDSSNKADVIYVSSFLINRELYDIAIRYLTKRIGDMRRVNAADLLYLRAEVYVRLGCYKRALDDIGAFDESGGDGGPYYHMLKGIIYKGVGRSDLAQKEFDEQIKTGIGMSEAYDKKYAIHMANEQYDLAERDIISVLSDVYHLETNSGGLMIPEAAEYFVDLANLQYRKGDSDAALRLLVAAARHAPFDARIYFVISELLKVAESSAEMASLSYCYAREADQLDRGNTPEIKEYYKSLENEYNEVHPDGMPDESSCNELTRSWSSGILETK